MFVKYYKAKNPNKTGKDFRLKVLGVAEYIQGEQLFCSFPYVISKVSAGQKVELALVENSTEAEEDFAEEFPAPEFIEDPHFYYDHDSIRSDVMPWDQQTCISIWEMASKFRLKVVGVENIKVDDELPGIYLTAGLYHGGEIIAPEMRSTTTTLNASPRWYEWITTNIQLCNIPRVS
jgi:hypothetical protein